MQKFLISNFKFLIIIGFILFFPTGKVHAVTLYSGAANQTVYKDQTFVVDWFLDTEGQEINSVSLKIKFNSEVLDAVETATGNSAIDLWVKFPEFSNQSETIELIGGIAGGAKSKSLPLFRTTFRAKTSGTGKISLENGSSVLLSDGFGTEVPLKFTQLNFGVNSQTFTPDLLSSSTHPDPDRWYKDRRVVIEVRPKPQEEYSYSFSSNLELIPDDIPDRITNIVFDNLVDGIYYFKLNSRVGNGNWEEASVYRVQIDSEPPLDFKPKIGFDPDIFEGKLFVTYTTTDKISGIDHYEVRVGLLDGWTVTDKTFFILPSFITGENVEVKAVDTAGNERIAIVSLKEAGAEVPFFNKYFWVIIIIGALLAAIVFSVYKQRKVKKR
jgi:hypothetical protein